MAVLFAFKSECESNEHDSALSTTFCVCYERERTEEQKRVREEDRAPAQASGRGTTADVEPAGPWSDPGEAPGGGRKEREIDQRGGRASTRAQLRRGRLPVALL